MSHDTASGSKKKSYATPLLVEYGSVAKLTERKSGPIPDGKSGMSMRHGKGGGGGKKKGFFGFGEED